MTKSPGERVDFLLHWLIHNSGASTGNWLLGWVTGAVRRRGILISHNPPGVENVLSVPVTTDRDPNEVHYILHRPTVTFSIGLYMESFHFLFFFQFYFSLFFFSSVSCVCTLLHTPCWADSKMRFKHHHVVCSVHHKHQWSSTESTHILLLERHKDAFPPSCLMANLCPLRANVCPLRANVCPLRANVCLM